MKAHTISPLQMQLTQYGAVNVYLVIEDDGFTLVDTGMNCARQILNVAKSAGLPIRRIALTHAHLDHAGSLEALVAALPDVEVIVSRREARLLAGDKTLDADEPHIPLKGTFRPTNVRVHRVVEEGDQVGSLRVIASPGHTPGHVAYFDTRNGALLAGDAWSVLGGLTPGGVVCPLFPLPAWGTWNRRLALASARKLCALEPKYLAVGHGRFLADPKDAMTKALAGVQEPV